jgi:hypothetical protein
MLAYDMWEVALCSIGVEDGLAWKGDAAGYTHVIMTTEEQALGPHG